MGTGHNRFLVFVEESISDLGNDVSFWARHSDLLSWSSGRCCLQQQEPLATHHRSEVRLTHPPELLSSHILGPANDNIVLRITGRAGPHFPSFRVRSTDAVVFVR